MRIPDQEQLVLANTRLVAPFLCPELRLHLVTEDCPWWRCRPEELEAQGVDAPFWGFAWAGGQALARYVMDHPQLMSGRVLDFGAGCGICGLGAARAGAAQVLAADIDPVCEAACRLDAAANGLAIETCTRDLLGRPADRELGVTLVLAGDMTYDEEITRRALAWFRDLAARGVTVLIGDPGRGFLEDGLEPLGTYDAPADNDTRGAWLRETTVWRVRA